MNAVKYARVKEVFSQAIERTDEERAAFVRQQCGGDDQILREVLSLLEHHRSGTVLEVPRQLPSRPSIVSHPEPVDPYLVINEVWEDNRQILRRRLTIIACVMAILIAISLVRLFTYHYAAWGYGVRITALAISVGCAWVLDRKRDLTLSQIRIAELLVMANAGLLAIVITVRLMLDAANRQDLTIISIHNWNYFIWALIILIYGVFMPNTWQRAAAILLPVAAIPGLVTGLAGIANPQVFALLEYDDFGMPIPAPFFASCLAIYAAHTIHDARVSVFQARRLAQYHLKRLIGQGGMGQVFEAEHLLLKRSCAIKLIHPAQAIDDRALQRFEREVRATAKLTHPHTIEVYDYGQTKDSVFFFAMELLPGMNLRDLVTTEGPLPAARAVHFLTEVCEALQEAHSIGLIHRDIKPANIFASQRGGIFDFTKLLDFGVVRESQVDLQHPTTSDLLAGTPAFMSPEQITTPTQIDARTDIYSLGAVAYFLLTGRPPFVADSPMEVLLAQVQQLPAPPSTYQPGIPADLESVIMRCLAKSVEERFADVTQLHQELQKCSCAGDWTQKDAADWWSERAT